jgi:hypothetical protein
MNKRNIIFGIVVSLVFVVARPVFAGIIFNEVQLSPTEERFIELYNTGSSPVDLTDWYIQRKTATGSSFGSLVSKTYFEGKTIEANSYFIISRSGNDADIIYPGLTLTESNTIQIKNSNQEVIDKIGWGSVNDCENNCASNPNDGESIQKISGSWDSASPTPGESNSSNSSSVNEETSSNDPSDVLEDDKEEKIEIYKLTTKIIINKVLVAGIDFPVNSLTTDNKKQTMMVGGYVWNFGDGSILEEKSANISKHTYQYPGEYILTLNYFKLTSFDGEPDATDRIIVKVIPADIFISSVGNSGDAYVELENKSKYEIDLSNWVLKGNIKSFTIPVGTKILSNKKVRFSSKITGFDFSDLKNISLISPNGENTPRYSDTTKNSNYSVSRKEGDISSPTSIKNDSNIINLDDLGASAVGARADIPSSFYYIGLAVIIILGGTAVFLSRRKFFSPRSDLGEGEVEGKIRPEDINIME